MRIVYKTETGIAIINLVGSIESCMKDIPTGEEYKIVDESEIPTDRTFRNAWNFDLKEDIPKSKEIWKEKIRQDRKPMLESLDVDYQRADEDKDEVKKADIIKEKNRLRDITDLIDKCKTTKQIKSITCKIE